jgi:peroxiredoxin Q/BCP
MPGVGDPAPSFSLAGTGDKSYALSDYRGQIVVLVFYPGDNTPVCTNQLTTYTREIAQFDEVKAQILAISPQDVPSHEKFACTQGGFGFPLLADVGKEVAREYGVLGPLGFYRRSVFVIDEDGMIRYVHRSVAGLTFRPVAELVTAVQSVHR